MLCHIYAVVNNPETEKLPQQTQCCPVLITILVTGYLLTFYLT